MQYRAGIQSKVENRRSRRSILINETRAFTSAIPTSNFQAVIRELPMEPRLLLSEHRVTHYRGIYAFNIVAVALSNKTRLVPQFPESSREGSACCESWNDVQVCVEQVSGLIVHSNVHKREQRVSESPHKASKRCESTNRRWRTRYEGLQVQGTPRFIV